MSYRVVSRPGGYVAQFSKRAFLFWTVWEDMFVGPASAYHGAIRLTFPTPKLAMEAVRDADMRTRTALREPYAQTFYIANNGQICPTEDHDR